MKKEYTAEQLELKSIIYSIALYLKLRASSKNDEVCNEKLNELYARKYELLAKGVRV